MKKHIVLFSLLVTLFTTMFPTSALAQQPDNQYAMLYWQNNGEFNAFLNEDVDSITYSKVDFNGRRHSNVVVQEIWTSDSVYRIPLATIDSVTFNVPEPVFKDDIFHITEFHFPYVTDVTETTVTFDASIPSDSLPSVGQVVISDIAYEEPFVNGFAGRVTRIVSAGGIVRIECEEVSIEDIYNELVCIGKVVTYNDSSSIPRAPRRLINEQGEIPIPFGNFSLNLYKKGSEQVTLNVRPKITLDYVIRYKLFDSANNRFRFIVKKELDCDFNYNWEKSIDVDTVIFPSDALIIHTPVTGLNAFVNIGGYLDFSGSATLDLTQRFIIVSQFGYDSKENNNGRNGLVFGFDGTDFYSPTGSAKLNTTLSAGLAFQVGVCLISDKIAGANLTLKAGPRVSGDIEFNTDMAQGPSWYDFNESCLTFEPLTARLSGGVNIFTYSKDWNLWELPISSWFPAFNAQVLHLFPQFTAPSLPGLDESGCSLTALSTGISRNLLFSVTPGIGLYKNNQLKYTCYSNKTYKHEGDLKNTDLQMELQQYASDTYTAKPIFKIFNKTVEAYPTSTVTVPASLSVPNAVTVKNGESQIIDINGGWGNYTLTNSAASICRATFVSNGTDVGTTWPPTSGSGYSNQTPKVKLTGLNNGNATITVTDKRSNRTATTSVVVNNPDQPPMITVNPETWDFGTVANGSTNNKNITIKGYYLNGNVTITPASSSYFTISPTTISKADATVGKQVTVTYNPTATGNHSATFTVSSDGAMSKTITVTGKSATLSVDASTKDLGTVYLGASKSVNFTITGVNLSQAITLVEPFVETTGDEFNITPTSLSSNGGTVNVTYTPLVTGTAGASFTFKSGNLTVRFSVSAKCVNRPAITVSTTNLEFGTVAKGSSNTKKFTVTGTDLTGNVTITPASSSYFTISPTTISKADAAAGKQVTVTYNPTETGNHSATFTISSDGATSKTITVSGKSGTLTVSPQTKELGNVYKGSTATANFTITGTNLSGPITLMEPFVETTGGEFSISPSSLHASGGTVTVTYSAQHIGAAGAAFKYKCGNIIANFSVSATCVNKPAINVSTSTLEFGMVAKGSSNTKKFTVTGTDLTGNVTISPASSSYFTISPTTISKADATAGKQVTVTYNPTATGNHSATFTVSSDGATSKTITVNGKSGTLTVSPQTKELGNVYKGSTATATFTITGTNLSGPITLVEPFVETTGGEFSISPESLPASGGTVTVTYSAQYIGAAGAAFKYKCGNIIANFSVSATCVNRPAITVSTTNLEFGTVAKGSSNTKKFTVTGTDLTGNVTISPASSSYFTISPTTISKADATAGKQVTVTYNPTATGNHSATFTVSSDGATSKTITVTGKSGTLTVSPQTKELGNVYKGSIATATFTITGTNLSGPITLVEPFSETTGGEFSIYPKSLPASGGTVTVTYTALYAGAAGAAFKYKCGNLIVNFSVSANCVNKPAINVSTSTLEFGTVAKGSSNTKKFTVTGIDLTGNVTISPASSSYFTISPTTISKADAAAGKQVTVTYNPTATGNHSATFTISSDGATSKTITVTGKSGTLTVSPQNKELGNVYKGSIATATFTITGTNLSGPITLVEPFSETTGGEFSIYPKSLPASGGTVTVTYTALYAGAAGAAFKYKCGNLIVNFSVSANCIVPSPSVSVNPGSVEFNASGSSFFNVKGSNLTNDLLLVLKNNSNGYFSINKTTISKADALSSSGSNVKVTFTRPTLGNLTHASAQVEIRHNGTLLKTVYLSYLNDSMIQPELNSSGPTDEETASYMKEAD